MQFLLTFENKLLKQHTKLFLLEFSYVSQDKSLAFNYHLHKDKHLSIFMSSFYLKHNINKSSLHLLRKWSKKKKKSQSLEKTLISVFKTHSCLKSKTTGLTEFYFLTFNLNPSNNIQNKTFYFQNFIFHILMKCMVEIFKIF